MPNTYTLIASSTVGSGGAASIDFTSIPSTYTDLVLKVSLRGSSTSGNFEYWLTRFNGSSGANYTTRSLIGYDGTAVYSGTRASQTELWSNNSSGGANNSNDTANTFSNGEMYIPNYLSSNQKSVSIDSVSENNSSLGRDGLAAGIWSLTSAITSISMFPLTGTWVQYSTAYLYGVKSS